MDKYTLLAVLEYNEKDKKKMIDLLRNEISFYSDGSTVYTEKEMCDILDDIEDKIADCDEDEDADILRALEDQKNEHEEYYPFYKFGYEDWIEIAVTYIANQRKE